MLILAGFRGAIFLYSAPTVEATQKDNPAPVWSGLNINRAADGATRLRNRILLTSRKDSRRVIEVLIV